MTPSRPIHRRFGQILASTLAIATGLATVFVSVSLMAHPASAKFGLEGTLGAISNKPATYTNDENALPNLIGGIVKTALSLVGVVFLLLMIYGGFLWMTARGDSKTTQKSKDLIIAAIIGMIIVGGAYAITSFVLSNLAPAADTGAGTSSGPVTQPGP